MYKIFTKNSLYAISTAVLFAAIAILGFRAQVSKSGYFNNGQFLEYTPDYSEVYVTYTHGVDRAEVLKASKNELAFDVMLTDKENSEKVMSIRYHLSDKSKAQELLEKMNDDPLVASAYPAYRHGNSKVLVSNEILFVVSSTGQAAEMDLALESLESIGGYVQKTYVIGRRTFVKVVLDKTSDVWKAAQVLASSESIQIAQPNFVRQMNHSLVPNDPRFSEQWFLDQSSDADIDAPEAWEITSGNENVIVSVWDTGFQTNHPELASKFVYTYDAIEDNSSVSPENANDNHGTPCIALIGTVTNNGVGVAGIAPGIKVMPVDIGFGINAQGSFSTLSEGFVRAAAWVVSKPGVVAVSCSYGGSGSDPIEQAAYQSVIDDARNGKGAVVLASTGNDGTENEVQYPVYYPNVVGVGASNQTDAKASFSNFGDSTDIIAPGVSTLTLDRTGTNGYGTTDYTFFAGTSAACPVAAGVIGLIASGDTNLTSYELVQAMAESAEKVGGIFETKSAYPLGTWSNTHGYGRVNAANGLSIVTSNDRTVLNEEGITISPNPVTDGNLLVVVAKPKSRYYNLRVVGIDGSLLQELVFTPIAGGTPVIVQVTNKPKGLGFVEIRGADGKVSARKKVIFY